MTLIELDTTEQTKLRRGAKLNERLTPCQFCEYPLSERHHILPVSMFGENMFTLQLCANCHELYHIVERVFLYKSEGQFDLLDAFKTAYGKDDIRLKKAYHFIAFAVNTIGGGQQS